MLNKYKDTVIVFVFLLIPFCSLFASNPFAEDVFVIQQKSDDTDISANTAQEAPTLEEFYKKFDDFQISIEGNNCCGQFAMTSVLNGYGHEVTGEDVFSETNPGGIFTSPRVVTEYLNQFDGINAKQRNNATLDDIIAKIDSGNPVIAMVNTTDVAHWINVYGYETDKEGNITHLRIRDTVWGDEKPKLMEIDDFLTRWKTPMGDGTVGDFVAWEQPFGDNFFGNFVEKTLNQAKAKRLDDLIGYSNFLIDINGDPSLPERPAETAIEDKIAYGINQIVAGFKNKNVGQVAKGVGSIASGVGGVIKNIFTKK